MDVIYYIIFWIYVDRIRSCQEVVWRKNFVPEINQENFVVDGERKCWIISCDYAIHWSKKILGNCSNWALILVRSSKKTKVNHNFLLKLWFRLKIVKRSNIKASSKIDHFHQILCVKSCSLSIFNLSLIFWNSVTLYSSKTYLIFLHLMIVCFYWKFLSAMSMI